jgi:flagellar protein FlbD
MIEVTKLNGERIFVNADHIEIVEAQPDTVLVLENGKHIIVREEVEEVVRRAVEYQRAVRADRPPAAGPDGAGSGQGGRRKGGSPPGTGD